MIDNAISYYFHLREQGLSVAAATHHTVQRFGVSDTDLFARVMGGVADKEATRAALAETRAHLTGTDEGDAEELLRDLYRAITGESL